jgi:hypothetical protein
LARRNVPRSWGIPLAAAIAESAQLTADLRVVAHRMVKLFETHVWKHFAADGFPAERLPGLTEALRKVRPLTATAVLSVLARVLEEAVTASAPSRRRGSSRQGEAP